MSIPEIEALRQAGITNPERDWRILEREFQGEARQNALKARLNRQPMSQILGKRDFWKDEFIVTKEVLDPRPDSELFIEIAIESPTPFNHILDLGTGSGALGLSLLREFPEAKATLSDRSQSALEIAQKNAENLKLTQRTRLIESNWFDKIQGQYELIICNPPYLSPAEYENAQKELKFEPKSALTDDVDGLSPYRILAKNLDQFLAPNGLALFEHGYNQQAHVKEIFAQKGFATREYKDLNGKPRIVAVFLPKIGQNTQ